MWFLLQSTIVLLAVWANQTLHWFENGIQIGVIAFALAWIGTRIAMAIINVRNGRPSNYLVDCS